MGKVTDLAAWKAAHPAREALRWHQATESILRSNLRIAAAVQRLVWTTFWRL